MKILSPLLAFACAWLITGCAGKLALHDLGDGCFALKNQTKKEWRNVHVELCAVKLDGRTENVQWAPALWPAGGLVMLPHLQSVQRPDAVRVWVTHDAGKLERTWDLMPRATAILWSETGQPIYVDVPSPR